MVIWRGRLINPQLFTQSSLGFPKGWFTACCNHLVSLSHLSASLSPSTCLFCVPLPHVPSTTLATQTHTVLYPPQTSCPTRKNNTPHVSLQKSKNPCPIGTPAGGTWKGTVLGDTSTFFPEMLLSKKTSEPQGKRLVVEKNDG